MSVTSEVCTVRVIVHVHCVGKRFLDVTVIVPLAVRVEDNNNPGMNVVRIQLYPFLFNIINIIRAR